MASTESTRPHNDSAEMDKLMDSRFTGALVLDDSGKIQGNYIDRKGHCFRYTLNLRKTGFYALSGTLALLDPSTQKPLQIKGETTTLASKPLHIKFPRAGESQDALIIRAIELTAYQFAEKYHAQYLAEAQKSKLLCEMTLTEALVAYLSMACISYSSSQTMRDEYKRQLNHLAKGMMDPLCKLTRKALNNALPAEANDATKRKYLFVLRHFVEFVEGQQHIDSAFLPTVDYCLSRLSKQSTKKNNRKAMLNASNSDILSDAAEEILNNRILDNQEDPYYIAIALIKGGGLSVQDICDFKIRDVQLGNLDEVFLALKREYASATQNYCFPILAWEARLMHSYFAHLAQLGNERMDGDRYLLSTDDGNTPLNSAQITELCRLELQRLKFGYADLLGNTDLRKSRGTELLRATYRHRLEAYCGLTTKTDEGARLFMLHQSLGNKMQADHYRSFTAESGRQCLLNYVRQDRRFIPHDRRKHRKTTRRQGGRDIHVLANTDQKNEQQATITFELGAGEVAEFFTQYGGRMTIEEITYL